MLKLKDALNPLQGAVGRRVFGPEVVLRPQFIHLMGLQVLVSMLNTAWDRINKRELRWRLKLEMFKKTSDKLWEDLLALRPEVPVKERIQLLKKLFKEIRILCDLCKTFGDLGRVEAEKRQAEVRELLDAMQGKGALSVS